MLLQNLCFTKKIRYESRTQRATARPGVKGQFVRRGPAPDGGDGEALEGGSPQLPNAEQQAAVAVLQLAHALQEEVCCRRDCKHGIALKHIACVQR